MPDPVATQPQAPAAQPNAAPQTQPVAPGAAPEPWTTTLDPELRGVAELKGWKTPADAVKAYRGAEQLIGVAPERRLTVPAEGAEQKEWDALYNRLGRPDTPDGYKLPIPEGDSGEFAKAAAPVLHSIGLSQQQAAKLGEFWNGYVSNVEQSLNAEMEQTQQVELQQLRTEWGSAFDQRIELGRRTAREFGIDATMMSGIEEAVGTARFLKMMADIGSKLGESQYTEGHDIAGGGNPTFGMTPAAAQARIKELMGDKEWGAKYLNNPGGPEGRELDRLQKIAYLSQG